MLRKNKIMTKKKYNLSLFYLFQTVCAFLPRRKSWDVVNILDHVPLRLLAGYLTNSRSKPDAMKHIWSAPCWVYSCLYFVANSQTYRLCFCSQSFPWSSGVRFLCLNYQLSERHRSPRIPLISQGLLRCFPEQIS